MLGLTVSLVLTGSPLQVRVLFRHVGQLFPRLRQLDLLGLDPAFQGPDLVAEGHHVVGVLLLVLLVALVHRLHVVVPLRSNLEEDFEFVKRQVIANNEISLGFTGRTVLTKFTQQPLFSKFEDHLRSNGK